MDLRQYFRKLREIESSIEDPVVLVSSLGTADGGKPGVVSEVPRSIAAKLLVEGRAVLASDVERQEYRARQAAAKEAAEKADIAKRIQVAILSDPMLQTAVSARKSNTPAGSGK